MSRSKGFEIESQAQRYLYSHGLTPLNQNYTCKMGEIDLIMYEPDHTIIFIEVKFRANNQYGTPAETITASKQHKIRRTAQLFLLKTYQSVEIPCRFDVICASPSLNHNGTIDFNWIKNAF